MVYRAGIKHHAKDALPELLTSAEDNPLLKVDLLSLAKKAMHNLIEPHICVIDTNTYGIKSLHRNSTGFSLITLQVEKKLRTEQPQ